MNPLNTSEAFSTEPTVIPVVGESLRFVSERMGKITQAVVLISTVVYDPHHLMNDLVGYATQTLSDVYCLESDPTLASTADVSRITIGLRHIITTADICHTAGLLSDMNYQIMLAELKNLDHYVQEKLATYCIGQVDYPFRVPESESKTSSSNQISLDRYFQGIGQNDKQLSQSNQSDTKIYQPYREVSKNSVSDISLKTEHGKNLEKDIEVSSVPKITFKPQVVPAVDSHKIEHKSIQQSSIKPISGEDKKERRDAIMKTIRSKGQVTIRDISKNIHGCSEKTIQRDLQELIQHGVLIREGEKRWAVYKLAMNNV